MKLNSLLRLKKEKKCFLRKCDVNLVAKLLIAICIYYVKCNHFSSLNQNFGLHSNITLLKVLMLLEG